MINPIMLSQWDLLAELVDLHDEIIEDIDILNLFVERDGCEIARDMVPLLGRIRTVVEEAMQKSPHLMYTIFGQCVPAYEMLTKNMHQALPACPAACTCALRRSAVDFIKDRIDQRDSTEVRHNVRSS